MRIDLGVMLAHDRLKRHAAGPLGGLALVLLCCTVYLPGFFSIPPVDRDESRFAQASRQMFESVALPEAERDPELHSGGLAVPMVGGKERLNKPPLIYWLQAGSAAVFTGADPLRDAIWMYRVPSLLAGVVIVLATWRVGCSMFDPRVGWVGACLLAVSPVFVWEAHQARADMVMVAWTVLAMGQLWGIWKHRGATGRSPVSDGPDAQGVEEEAHWTSSSGTLWSAVLLWVFVALGVMTKGPITPMVVVLAAGWLSVFSRDWRWLRATRPLLGSLIVAAAVAPWVYAVAQQVGFSNYWQIVSDEVFGRAGSAKEGHWGPPGYHIVLLVVLFWPGSLLTGLSIGRARRRGYQSRGREHAEGGSGDGVAGAGAAEGGATPSASLRSRLGLLGVRLAGLRVARRPEAFLIAWMAPSWVVFELVGTKLPHYTMPLYPAVALITARGLLAWRSLGPNVQRRAMLGAWIWYLVGVLVLTLALFAGGQLTYAWPVYERDPMLYAEHADAIRSAAWVTGTVVAVGCAAVGLLLILRRDPIRLTALAVLASVALLGSRLPALAKVFAMTSHVTAAVVQEGGYSDRPVAWVEFFEDSLVFLHRRPVERVTPSEIWSWADEHPDGLIVWGGDQQPSDREIAAAGLDLLGIVGGVNYTKGRFERVHIYRGAPLRD